MKDFRDVEVAVGDEIFYSTTGRFPESRLAKVVRITAKTIFVEVLRTNRNGAPKGEIRVNNSFVIVTKAGVSGREATT